MNPPANDGAPHVIEDYDGQCADAALLAAWCAPPYSYDWAQAYSIRAGNSVREQAAIAAMRTAYEMARVLSPTMDCGRRAFQLSALDKLDDFRANMYFIDTDCDWVTQATPIVARPPVGRGAGDRFWHFHRSHDPVAKGIVRGFSNIRDNHA